nr:MAG TPA: hypothetical protein [Caudoviricetes sp.]
MEGIPSTLFYRLYIFTRLITISIDWNYGRNCADV